LGEPGYRGKVFRFNLVKLHQSNFHQPSDCPKLRQQRCEELYSRVAPNLHRVNDRDTEDVSEIGRIKENHEKRRQL